METIYKYPLEITDEQEIELPVYSEPLCIKVQHDVIPVLYCQVDPELETTKVRIRCYGTGQTIEDPAKARYIGTAMTNNGIVAWHYYINR